MRLRILFGTAFIALVVVACSSGGSDPPGGASSTSSSSGGSSSGTTSGSSSGGSSGTTTSSGGSSGTIGPNQLSFTGKQEGTTPPAGTKVVVLWSVFSGSPDYLFSFGSGQTTGADVFVTLGGPPPADALNGGKLGIGLVATLDDGADLPEGKVTGDWENVVRAITPMHAVIYRTSADQVTSKGWDVSFPQGYACGKCVEADAGFDTFEVTDCSNLVLVPASPEPKFCNFT